MGMCIIMSKTVLNFIFFARLQQVKNCILRSCKKVRASRSHDNAFKMVAIQIDHSNGNNNYFSSN